MASVHAAHARRGDRVTSWWRGTSLRAKVTGVTVAVLAVGLLAAGLGTGVFLRNAQIAALDQYLLQLAPTDVASTLARSIRSRNSAASLTCPRRASSAAICIATA